MAGSRIFISYRRGDASAHAARLADRLAAEFGEDRVFMDVDTIEPGADFVDYISEAVGECDVLIALIGSEWLESRDEVGNRRLDDPRTSCAWRWPRGSSATSGWSRCSSRERSCHERTSCPTPCGG